MLPAESSSEPGKWTSIPYQIAIMDACCHPRISRITWKKSKRVGYTKSIGNVIGYRIHQDPCSILVVQPTLDDAEGWSKEEFAPTIEQTPVLAALVAPPRSRDSGNTILRKRYTGGILHVVGANSARGFRRITVELVVMDEIDAYPPSAGNEGDQEKLAEGRSETAWNRKIIKGSTPTEEGLSRIGRSWSESSQGHYLLACPHCGGEHIRRFAQPEKPIESRGEALPVSYLDQAAAMWVCPHCSARIDQSHHRRMIEGGYWRGEDWEWRAGLGFTFLPGFTGHVGFHIWAGYSYSPNSTPAHLIAEYLEAKDDTERAKTFTNTVLGEEWSEPGEQTDAAALMRRAEVYPAEVPPGVVALTCGVDVQGDRLELEVVGWGAGEESWSIDYQVLVGDPTQDDVWEELTEIWERGAWERADGSTLRLAGMCVDSGYLPRRVYRFVQNTRSERVWPIKGRNGAYPAIENKTIRDRHRARRKRSGAAPEMLGVDELKMILTRRLKIAAPGPGYCHFPDDRPEEWYRQLTGEKMIIRYPRGGQPVRIFHRTYHAVEALDCRGYAHAALMLSGIDVDREAKQTARAVVAASRDVATPPAQRPPVRPARGGGWVGRWK